MRDVAGQIAAESELPSVCSGASNKLAVGSPFHILAGGFYTFGIAAIHPQVHTVNTVTYDDIFENVHSS